MRLLLAIRAFFAVLFGSALPDELVEQALLTKGEKPAELPAETETGAAAKREVEALKRELDEAKRREAEAKAEATRAKAEKPVEVKAPQADASAQAKLAEAAAVRAIAVFQSEGRLFDFLSEEIDGYSDADVGAAVREIHRGCKRALADHFEVSPVRSEAEDSMITVPEGYDPAEVRLVGNVVGKPPFSGTLKHRGWKVVAVRLPNIPEGKGAKVIVPAEVEV
ncbi:DUF2760 domain-containing protein [Myxococcota bacterium]|nr:DUF2760 domain-containing protein [Myxococcota bacterium]